MSTSAAAQSTLLSRRDVRFLLFEWLHVERLVSRARYEGQSREEYEQVLELAERLSGDLFAPHNRLADLHEPRVEDGRVVLRPEVGAALGAFCEAGFMGTSLDQAVGGMQLPFVLASAVVAWFHAANASTTGYALLTTAAANMLMANGSTEQVARWVPPMVEGRFFGTMCLSEPHVGSALGYITTRCEPRGDGTHRLFGTKMWISAGEHELTENIVHLVLARDPNGPPGVRGISLFIVPRFLLGPDGSPGMPNDVTLTGLNHKMGYRGTVNTVLGFGEGVHRPGGEPGAIGYLVGEPGGGLPAMFRMMNEARIGVGTAATALGYTGYLKSLRYARERQQGHVSGRRDPPGSQVPIIEHADVRRMLLAQKAYVEGALALVLYCGRLHDDVRTLEDGADRERAELLLELLTPIAKSWPAQWCLAANSLAMQVMGGAGYSRDHEIEQHYRDNRLNPIHEGTHGIQAIDLLGRKVAIGDGAAFDLLCEVIRATVERAQGHGAEAADLARQLAERLATLELATRASLASSDRVAALANATPYLEATGHVVVAWLWLEQFLAASAGDDRFYEGKRQAARYFFRCELPKTGLWLDLVRATDRTALDTNADWL
jgi:butyryl-CoA dehydrogenase